MNTSITSYEKQEELGRVRLSEHFFMRDFLHSEIAAWHGLRNIPDHPDAAIYPGQQLCQQLLEPLQATFGRIHVRSGYRSRAVNAAGTRYAMDFPTPVPASTNRFSEEENAFLTASAIATCSMRGSNSSYNDPTSPVSEKA